MAFLGVIAGNEILNTVSLLAAFGINSILYQRGIYPPETFTRVTQYDLSLMLTTDSKLKTYLANVVTQLKGECPHLDLTHTCMPGLINGFNLVSYLVAIFTSCYSVLPCQGVVHSLPICSTDCTSAQIDLNVSVF